MNCLSHLRRHLPEFTNIPWSDDGGIHGLSELFILKELMDRLKASKKLDFIPPPCEVFDMIAGSGTGGYVR